jgi:hypothetical protein
MGAAENHKKGYCSDGVKQNMERSAQNDDPPSSRANQPPNTLSPQWPQPRGIFTNGTHFDALTFLTTIREMYEKVVVNSDSGELLMEHEAFASLLVRRTVVHEGFALFKLFKLGDLYPMPEGLLIEHEGCKFLRIDCLRDT